MLGFSVLVLALASSAQSQEALVVGRLNGSVDPYSGLASLPLVLSWPATSVRLRFQDSVAVTVFFEPVRESNSGVNNSFRFELDDAIHQQYIGSNGSWSQSQLSIDAHDLRVTKLTEALYGIVVLSSVQLTPNGRSATLHAALQTTSGKMLRDWKAQPELGITYLRRSCTAVQELQR